MKITDSKPHLIIKLAMIVLSILIFIPMTSLGNYMTVIRYDRPYTLDMGLIFTFWPSIIFLIIGLSLNLFSIIKKNIFQFISILGMTITISIFFVNLILSLLFFFTAEFINKVLFFQINFFLVIIVIGMMIFERIFLHYNNQEINGEIIQKSKGFLKRGLKTVSKKAGKIAGDMLGDIVEDKITEITGDAKLADMVGDLTDESVSKLATAGISTLTEKGVKATKPKGFLKKGLKGVTKKVGKIAGDMVGDAISDLTDNAELGEMVGKFAKKGVSKLADSALGDKTLSTALPTKAYTVSDSPVSEPIKIDFKKSILGIIKTKKQVKIDYIEKTLKLDHNDTVGLIYELIGKGKIEGEFNSDDSEFILKD